MNTIIDIYGTVCLLSSVLTSWAGNLQSAVQLGLNRKAIVGISIVRLEIVGLLLQFTVKLLEDVVTEVCLEMCPLFLTKCFCLMLSLIS